MNRYLLRFRQELQKKGIRYAFLKGYRNLGIRMKRSLTLNTRSYKAWKDVKNKYIGKRAFLIGNGPSLNKTPLFLLQGEYTMCFNRFNIMYERLNWRPSFYMCVDALVAEDIAKEINEVVKEVEIAFFPDIHTHGLDFRTFIKERDNIQWMFPEFKGFYFDLPKVALGGTVAYPALQVLTYLGFSEIYLVGVDMNYQIHETVKDIKDTDVMSIKNDDPNHFDPRYFGTNRKYHQPVKATQDNMMASMEYAAQQIKEHTAIKVFNAGIDSNVTCFEPVKFETLFNYTPAHSFALLSQSFKNLLPAEKAAQIFSEEKVITNKADAAGQKYFICDIKNAGAWTKELIFDFIPFGPFENKMLFIAREKSLTKNNA